MKQRNWLSLARKLIDRYDFNYTVNAMSEILQNQAIAFFGPGILITTTYPSPFDITRSSSVLGGSVSEGIATDESGNPTNITDETTGVKTFACEAADVSLTRFDMLVIRYLQVGDTSVPKPSDPLTTISLNLHDDFELVVRKGVAGSGTYAAKEDGDIILCGIQIPAGATLGTQCTIDLSIREYATRDAVKYPTFKQEVLTGTVNGTNKVFTISETPINSQCVLVMQSGLNERISSDYIISDKTITFTDAPAIGQTVYAFYFIADSSSTNPLTGYQEIPSGAVDGINDTYELIGKPPSKDATLVFVDGLLAKPDEWNLIQNVDKTYIQFTAGNILAPGQQPYCFYLVNPATVGVVTSSDVSAGYVVTGSPSSPAVISASVGIPSTSNQRRLVYVASAGGAVTITANPQISAGVNIGQELVIRGTSDTDYIILNDGNGLDLNGSINLTNNASLTLVWSDGVWSEISRR